eukprot:3795412-Ditylum_brightwellii.AAC.1
MECYENDYDDNFDQTSNSNEDASASSIGGISSISGSDIFSFTATSVITDDTAGGCSQISFLPCRNIDKALYSLHTSLSEVGPSPHD